MRADDFRSLTLEDLDIRIAELKKDFFNFRMQLHSNQLNNVNRICETRRDIARAMTVRTEKMSRGEVQK